MATLHRPIALAGFVVIAALAAAQSRAPAPAPGGSLAGSAALTIGALGLFARRKV